MLSMYANTLEDILNSIMKRYKLDKYLVNQTDKYYDHITFSVNSLSEYIDIIEKLFLIPKKSVYSLLFRGMSNHEWRLYPSIMRLKSSDRSFNLEHDLSINFMCEEPDLFVNSKNNFENLSKMQHFGIPTRLLDFTQNPLIALYFACSEYFKVDGRIVFTLNQLHSFNNSLVESISSLYTYEELFNLNIEKWLNDYNILVEDYLTLIYSSGSGFSPLFIKPVYLDKRMEAQRSVFLLFHNVIRDLLAGNIYYDYISKKKDSSPDLEKEVIHRIYEEQIKSPHFILGDLPWFFVRKNTFDELRKFYSEYDIDYYKKNITKIFSNRFLLFDEIEKLEMEDIWYQFSSILVPSNKKKKIIFELENIGIDSAFIYPSSENTAKRVKKYYF